MRTKSYFLKSLLSSRSISATLVKASLSVRSGESLYAASVTLRDGPNYSCLSNIVQDHVRGRYERTKERLEWLVELERRPNTSNNHYFCDYRDKFFGFYKGLRQRDKNPNVINHFASEPSEAEAKALSSLASLGFTVSGPDLQRLLPSDEMEPALKIMAEIRAYFQGQFLVSALRFSGSLTIFQLHTNDSRTMFLWSSIMS